MKGIKKVLSDLKKAKTHAEATIKFYDSAIKILSASTNVTTTVARKKLVAVPKKKSKIVNFKARKAA